MKLSLLIINFALIITTFFLKADPIVLIAIFVATCLLFFFLISFEKKERLKNEKVLLENNFMIKARDSLLHGVNHELRAPLSRMKLDLEFIEDQSIKKSLNEDINQIFNLVNELMDIEKIKSQGIVKEPVVLGDVLKEIVETLYIDHDQLYFNSDLNLVVEGNHSQLIKLFKNLIENAYKYKTPEGKVNISLSQKNDNKIVTIMNEGSTISGEDIPFIFEPFFRVNNKNEGDKKEGMGIGLNICKEIIEAHKAKIQVSSKKGYGTTFKITF